MRVEVLILVVGEKSKEENHTCRDFKVNECMRRYCSQGCPTISGQFTRYADVLPKSMSSVLLNVPANFGSRSHQFSKGSTLKRDFLGTTWTWKAAGDFSVDIAVPLLDDCTPRTTSTNTTNFTKKIYCQFSRTEPACTYLALCSHFAPFFASPCDFARQFRDQVQSYSEARYPQARLLLTLAFLTSWNRSIGFAPLSVPRELDECAVPEG
jgi:hypothetical protein